MAKEFIEKKNMIITKLQELRTNNRSIEEIYKYTNDIILEEEDEEEDQEINTSKLDKMNSTNSKLNTIEPIKTDAKEIYQDFTEKP